MSLLATLYVFFTDTATTEIYTLSLHDAIPISSLLLHLRRTPEGIAERSSEVDLARLDRKSTRLNSSHGYISYAVFCLKKKKNKKQPPRITKTNTTKLTNK